MAVTDGGSAREAVASFADREHFHEAVAELRAAGFAPSDLSVLATHRNLGSTDVSRSELIRTGLGDEIKYLAPLTIAGMVLISGGPVAAAIAALVGAGLGGAALKEFFDDYTAPTYREEFAAALHAGSVLLWVGCADAEAEERAVDVLQRAGGLHVHIHARRRAAVSH